MIRAPKTSTTGGLLSGVSALRALGEPTPRAPVSDVHARLAEALTLRPGETQEVRWTFSPALIAGLSALCRLEGVPFACLVPDPGALPMESLRVFFIDPDWQAALVLGAVTAAANRDDRLGRLTELHERALAWLRSEGALPQPGSPPHAGALLRSRLVAQHGGLWPQGYDADNKPMKATREAQLDERTRLVIWSAPPAKVTVDEPDAGVRLGWNPSVSAPTSSAELAASLQRAPFTLSLTLT